MKKIIIFLLFLFVCGSVWAIEDPPSWDLLDEDCSAIDDWVDEDTENSVSEVEPAGQFRLDCNTAKAGNIAWRTRDIGSFPDTYTFEIKLYHDDIGVWDDYDALRITIHNDDVRLIIIFASDNLHIRGGDSWAVVGANLVKETTWQTWRFVVNMTTPASATVDVYIDEVLQATGVDCSYTGTFPDGEVYLEQFGYTNNNMLSHIDYIRAATGLYPSAAHRRIIMVN